MGQDLVDAVTTFRKALRTPSGERFAKDTGKSFDEQVGELNRKMMDIQKRTGVAQKTFIRKIGIDLLRKIIEKNPVDTGRSRAAWAPLFEVEGLPFPKIENEDAKPTFDIEKAEGWVDDGETKGGYYLTIVNAVPYVLYLEYGSSDQAPEGMVRISMQELLDELRRAFR